MYFKEGFGLVTENDPVTENCNLFYAEYLLLKRNHESLSEEDKVFFTKNMEMKINDRGLYNRRSIETTPIRSVSHDEITGWLVASRVLCTDHGKDIWRHLISHFGTYNNTGRLSEALPFNPANFYAWGELTDSWIISKFFFIMYLINMLISINKKPQETSSKIIYWLELSAMPSTFLNKILFKIFEKRMIDQYGKVYVQSLFDVYFSMEDREKFPIFVQLKRS